MAPAQTGAPTAITHRRLPQNVACGFLASSPPQPFAAVFAAARYCSLRCDLRLRRGAPRGERPDGRAVRRGARCCGGRQGSAADSGKGRLMYLYSELVVLDHCGHMPQVEQPEACVRIARQFLG